MILRSDFPVMPGEKKDETKAGKSKLSPVHWGIIAACTFALLAIGAKMAFDGASKSKEAAIPPANVKPVAPAPAPTAATVTGGAPAVTAGSKPAGNNTTLESGTSVANVEPAKVVIKKVTPKPVVKVAKKVKKPVHSVAEVEVPRGTGAAAAHYRSTAASGDPFSSLKGSRSY